MTEKLCLRCDWTGETKQRACPMCGAGLFRPPGAPFPRKRRIFRRPERTRPRDAAPLATPSAESFDHSTPDQPSTPSVAVRRGGWTAAAIVALVAVVAVVVVQRATPPPPPTAPAPGLQGDLVFASSEGSGRSGLWIWDLETGAIRRGPLVLAPLQLVDAYRADPPGGWIGVVSQDGDEQVAGLLRNFERNDLPAEAARGDLVAWAPTGDRVAAATKPPDTCSNLRIESLHLATGIAKIRLDQRICGQLMGMGLDGFSPHVGLQNGDDVWISGVWGERARPWIRDASLVAVAESGGALVVSSCEAPDARPDTCGGLAYADPAFPGSRWMVPYGDRETGVLEPERFLGWGRDGRTGFVVGTYGEVRGVYAVTPTRGRPEPPRLIVPSLAADLYLAESYGVDGGELFVSRDGGLLLIRADGEQEPLALPEGVPAPDGPILWIAAAGGA